MNKDNKIIKTPFLIGMIQFIFPIPKKDIEKVVLLFLLFFFSSFVYNILLPLKKTILMYTPGAGSESMAYIKPFFITPLSFVLTAFFLSLSFFFTREYVFYTIVSLFTSYFILYALVLNPFREFFALHALADFMLSVLPVNFHAAPPLIRYWMHTFFYTFSELWGTTVVSLLIWGLVNDLSTEKEAKVTYALFTIGVNGSAIASGSLSSYLSNIAYNPNWSYGSTQWDQSFFRIMIAVISACCATLLMYRYFILKGYGQEGAVKATSIKPLTKKKEKISLLQCFREVLLSKNLMYISIVVMGYNIVYTLSDFVFVKRVELAFGADNQSQSNAFLSLVAMYTGVVATFFALVVNNLSLRYFGWTTTALMTPVIFILTGIGFYLIQMNFFNDQLLLYTIDPSLFILHVGAAHIFLLRGARYSVFDATKEMAYIGLTAEERLNGKAVIDGIASRFGKSGGSMIFFILFAFLGNDIIATIPYVFAIVTLLTVFWVRAVISLGKRYHDTENFKEEIKLNKDQILLNMC